MRPCSRRGELFFSISFFLFLISRLIKVSTLQVLVPVDSKVTWIIRGVILLFTLVKWSILKEYRRRHIVSLFVVLLFSIVQGVVNRNTILFDIVLLLILSYNVPLKTILKQYVFVVGGCMVVLFVLSLTGVIENFIFDAAERGLRYSFGHIYATDFAAMLLVLQMTVSVVFKFGKTAYFMVLSCMLGYIVYLFTDARTSFVLCVLFAVMRFVLPKLSFNWSKCLWISWLMPVLAILTFTLNAMYNPNVWLFRMFNDLLSGRLAAGHRAIYEVGISLLGNNISMKGNGWSPNPIEVPDIDYFIDASYLHVAIVYGIITLLIVVIGYSIYMKRTIEKQKVALTLSLVFIGIIAMIEHHLLEVIYNPFIFGLSSLWVSKWETNRSIDTIEIYD